MGASRSIGVTTARIFSQAGATSLMLTVTTHSLALPKTKKDETAIPSSSLKVTVLATDIANLSSEKLVTDNIAYSYRRLDLGGQEV